MIRKSGACTSGDEGESLLWKYGVSEVISTKATSLFRLSIHLGAPHGMRLSRAFIAGSTPARASLLAIIAIPTIAQLIVLPQWMEDHEGVEVYLVPVALNSSVLLTLVCFWLVSRTNPGSVPSDYNALNRHIRRKKGLKSAPERFVISRCNPCNREKPPRTHHCSKCKRCITAMDHHCPWVNNCIGYKNAGNFLRLLFYCLLSALLCSLVIALRLYDIISYERQVNEGVLTGKFLSIVYPSTMEFSVIFILSVLLFFLVLILGIMAVSQLYHVCGNKTTIEISELGVIKKLVREKKLDPELAVFPYNIGALGNFKLYLGPIWPLWWLPQKRAGDGVSFPVSKGIPEGYVWPPKVYREYKARMRGTFSSVEPMNIQKTKSKQRGDNVRTLNTEVQQTKDYVVKEIDEKRKQGFLRLCREDPVHSQDTTSGNDSDGSFSSSVSKHTSEGNPSSNCSILAEVYNEGIESDASSDDMVNLYSGDDEKPLSEILKGIKKITPPGLKKEILEVDWESTALFRPR